jgi:hypothetical protein
VDETGTEVAPEDAAPEPSPEAGAAGLAGAASFPLFSALSSRRARRVARGVSFSGTLGHQSAHGPAPLTPLEEAILITTTGTSGVVFHDGPVDLPGGGKEYGTHLMRMVGRTASNVDNAHSTHYFMINDEGIWLIRQRTDREALEFLREAPRDWSEWTDEHWLAAAAGMKIKVQEERLEFPREFPFYAFWNKQLSNRPGTTIFLPVVDCTHQYINVMLSLLSEEDGQRPLFVDDFSRFRPSSPLEWAAWAASKVGLVDKIPYQPVGGIKRVRSGFVNPENVVPLGYARAFRGDFEAHMLNQNLMLVAEALGLGGWIHAAVFPPYIYERNPAKSWYGLGFRQVPERQFRRWPPLPVPLPNFVGIDGVLEGLCPPYVNSMDEAVDRVVAEKYGERGPYGDAEVFGHPYREQADGETFLRSARRLTPEAIAYTKEICNYIYDTYGRFPAHIEAFHVPGVWVQFSHLEIDYYERMAESWYYARQARHDALWHG